MLEGATRDHQTATADGGVLLDLPEGVEIRERKNLITGNGVTTELFRDDWGLSLDRIANIVHVSLRAHAISAWHLHLEQTDHVFVTGGALRAALYDDREGSPTRGRLSVLHLSRHRPSLLILPPGIWHGFQNLEPTDSTFIGFFDLSYDYEKPDEWRLPPDTDAIPYRFPVARGATARPAAP